MAKFTDSKGHTWHPTLNIQTLRDVRDTLPGLDLTSLDKDLLEKIQDPFSIGLIMFCLCEEEAKERDISPEAFGRGLASGEVIMEARRALCEEIVNFTQKDSQESWRTVFRKMNELQLAQSTLMMEVLGGEKLDRVIEKQLEAAKIQLDALLEAEISGEPSTNVAESSESPS